MINPFYVFSGSFDPLHKGHLDIANYVESTFGVKVMFEICRKPFDKASLTDDEVEKRLDQFRQLNRVCVVTNDTSFMQRSVTNYTNSPSLNPKPRVFIVGFDTILRIDSKRYYFDSEVEKTRCIKAIGKTSRFLVFSRGESDRTKLSPEILNISDFVEDFIPDDVSSTEIRNKEVTETAVKRELRSLQNVYFGTCIKYERNLYKVIDDNGYLLNQVTLYNGEEFIRLPWETVVEVTDLKLWPKIN